MYIRQSVCEHKSAFAFVTLHVNLQDLASVAFICTKSEAACLHANVVVQMCSEAHSTTGPTCQCILPLLFDLSKGHSVSCIAQAPFPFNSLDVVLSLGLCGGAQAIIYCLFSKANVQAWHISFAEYISLLKCDFPPPFYFYFNVFHNMRWNAI